MASSLTCLIAVAIVMVPCARHADAQGTETSEKVEPCAIAPPALQIAAALEPVVREMCHRSPTFRRQLIRLADAPGLVVTASPGIAYRLGTVIAAPLLSPSGS